MVAALGTPRTFVKFSLTGLSGVVVNLGSFHFLLELGVHKYLASPIAIEISVISNFFITTIGPCRPRSEQPQAAPGLRFHIVSLLALGVSYSTFVVLSVLLPRLTRYGCKVSHRAGTLFNYFSIPTGRFGKRGVDRLAP